MNDSERSEIAEWRDEMRDWCRVVRDDFKELHKRVDKVHGRIDKLLERASDRRFKVSLGVIAILLSAVGVLALKAFG